MSDSEDDWFERDIDEFVVQTQQPNNVEHITVASVPDAENSVSSSLAFSDAGRSRFMFAMPAGLQIIFGVKMCSFVY